MKDQSTITKETEYERWDRGRTLFIESLLKPDNALRSCAHNQHCFDELMEIREDIVKDVKELKNPHKLTPGQPNKVKVKSINGISVTLLGGSLGEGYMKDWSEEHINEWKEYEKTLRE